MSTDNKITVLGKTFNSEEERRSYFREELRKKLPELKLMEGFPIGEDEDILNLSDPPYYTACPNPWLNDFIAEWEEEKKDLEKQGLRKTDFEVTEPYAADVSEGKNNPIYNAHSYYTKVPHRVIMMYILHYTQPGDIVFDGFGGTGMTGVAAQMCGTDNIDSREFQTKFGHKYKLGLRKSLCIELSPIASFLSYCFNSSYSKKSFTEDSKKILHDFKNQAGWVYKTTYNGVKCDVNYILWSDVYTCNHCSSEFLFWDVMMDEETGKPKIDACCKNCGSSLAEKDIERVFVSVLDNDLNDIIKTKKREIALMNFKFKSQFINKKPDYEDYKLLSKIESFGIQDFYPTDRTPNGSEGRRNDRFGITHIHQFYSKRNLIASAILNRLSNFDKHFKFGFFNTVWHGTLMRRYNSGGGHRPKTGTLYMPSVSSEGNIISIYSKKINQLRSFFKTIQGFKYGSFLQSTSSATQNNIADSSVDYIFTDPPFGGNIMYSELNCIWENWIKIVTQSNLEAIESKKVGKDLFSYQRLITNAFHEYFRILKPGKWMTVEFSNPSAAVWNSIQNSITSAGFIVANVSALDKKQKSINSYTTARAVKQDLIISCYKPSSEFDQKFNQHKHSDVGVWEFVAEHLEHLPIHLVSGNSTTAIIERSPKILFDRLIAFYVQRGLPVPIDSGKFQQGLWERFIERDGMFFNNEQVQEYDRKKAAVPNFVQLSIFVANEQDAIYWLRHILEKDPKTEQDLHPLWMKEVAGNMRKGDTLPEMRTILEENFLKNEKGQWYLPDPENEADLEKLRTKRLLKLFETYRIEAFKPKGKIKEARVEALRAGYKQCYQDKDFKTIVQIGDRIPNNLLMEDEVLLQFYDIAVSRI